MATDASPTPAPPLTPTVATGADAVSEAEGGELLRLAHCPACDYSLEGSPRAGVCPECGETYDDDGNLVLLFGWGPGYHRGAKAALPWRAIRWPLVLGVAFLGLVWIRPAPRSVIPMVIWTLGCCAFAIGRGLWRHHADAQRPPLRLWLTPLGAGWCSRRIRTPKLTPWAKVCNVVIVPLKPSLYRVTCLRTFWGALRWGPALDVELQLSDADARALEARIAGWHMPTHKRLAAARKNR